MSSDTESEASFESESSTSTNSQFVSNLHLPSALKELKRLERKLIDVNLKVADKKFPADGVVLANCKLEAMLSENRDPEKLFELDSKIIKSEIVEDLLDFFHFGQIEITKDNVKLLCIAANYFEIQDLKDATEEFILKHHRNSRKNAVEWYRFSVKFQLEKFRRICVKLIHENSDSVNLDKLFGVVNDSDDYLLNLFNGLTESLSNMVINEAMVKFLIQWIKHDPTRSDSLVDLLKNIPLSDLSENFFRHVIKDEIIRMEPKACWLLNRALEQFSDSPREIIKRPLESHLYCLGGNYTSGENGFSDKVSALNFTTREWKDYSPMVFSTFYFCATQMESKIYCFGGFREGKLSKIVKVLDTDTDRWTVLRSMPVARESPAAVAYKGCIYVSGGSDKNGVTTPEVYRYCVTTNRWQSMAPMNECRFMHKMFVHDGHIYAVGGGFCVNKTIEKYHPGANYWEIVAKTKYVFEPDAVLHQGKIYAFDGEYIEIYDPETNSMKVIKNSQRILWRPVVVSIDDRILVFDSEEEGRNFGSLDGDEGSTEDDPDSDGYHYDEESESCSYSLNSWIFNPATGEYKPIGLNMPKSRMNFRAVVIKR